MTTQRIETWEAALYAEIDSWREIPFAYGEADCTAFASACVRAMTGFDPWQDWKGRYKTAKSALGLIKRRKYKNLEGVLNELFVPCPVAFAGRGDLVMADLKLDFQQVGICLGRSSISCAPEGVGLIEAPTLEMKRAWHV